MNKGKVVLVPFPFDDLSGMKVRPAVCLSELIGVHNHVVLAFITSRVSDNILPTDLVLLGDHDDFIATGLRVDSTIQLHRMITVTTSIIHRQIGRLSSTLLRDVDTRSQMVFQLDIN